MLCTSCLLAIVLSLPETARHVVGNGGVAVKGIHCTPFNKPSKDSSMGEGPAIRSPATIPNPLATLSLLSRKDIAIVITSIGILYTAYSCLQASLATLFIQLYGYGQLEAGLIYLPFGFGCALAAYFTGESSLWPSIIPANNVDIGRLLDRDYRIMAKSQGLAVDVRYDRDMLRFPIEKARLRSFAYPTLTAIAAAVGYGWSLEAKSVSFFPDGQTCPNTGKHVAVPLVLQLILGSTLQCCFTVSLKACGIGIGRALADV